MLHNKEKEIEVEGNEINKEEKSLFFFSLDANRDSIDCLLPGDEDAMPAAPSIQNEIVQLHLLSSSSLEARRWGGRTKKKKRRGISHLRCCWIDRGPGFIEHSRKRERERAKLFSRWTEDRGWAKKSGKSDHQKKRREKKSVARIAAFHQRPTESVVCWIPAGKKKRNACQYNRKRVEPFTRQFREIIPTADCNPIVPIQFCSSSSIALEGFSFPHLRVKMMVTFATFSNPRRVDDVVKK